MKTLKIGIGFFDENDNIIAKRFLTSHWELKDEEIFRTTFDMCMQEEILNILKEQIKIDLDKGLLKDLLKEATENETTTG